MSAHTPGPWTVSDRIKWIEEVDGGHRHVCLAGGSWYDVAFVQVDEGDSEQEANAHLIAAAPEQHAALLAAPDPTAYSDDDYGTRCFKRDVLAWFNGQRTAAIAKAEGQ